MSVAGQLALFDTPAATEAPRAAGPTERRARAGRRTNTFRGDLIP